MSTNTGTVQWAAGRLWQEMHPVWREFKELFLFQLYLRVCTGVSGQSSHAAEQAERANDSQLAA